MATHSSIPLSLPSILRKLFFFFFNVWVLLYEMPSLVLLPICLLSIIARCRYFLSLNPPLAICPKKKENFKYLILYQYVCMSPSKATWDLFDLLFFFLFFFKDIAVLYFGYFLERLLSGVTLASAALSRLQCSVLTQSCPTLKPHGLQPTRLLCPWDFPGKNTGVGYHFLLQGIFLTQGLNQSVLHYRQILYYCTTDAVAPTKTQVRLAGEEQTGT